MKKKIVFLTGAGISAESGVKTFRDHGGLWEGHDVKEVATLDGWRKNKELVLKFYNQRRKQLEEVKPNKAHRMIAMLEKKYDVVVVTQNVDDLHERGGSSKIIHLHGELKKACSSRNKELTVPYKADGIQLGDKHEDGSQLRPYIVWFGEDVPLLMEAAKEVSTADILVIVGTSLQVYPAASLSLYAKAECELYYIDPAPAEDPSLEYFKVIPKVATEGMEDFFEEIEFLGDSDPLQTICDLMEEAKKYGLESEVAFYALKAMKEDPTLEPEQAFLIGYQEWVK